MELNQYVLDTVRLTEDEDGNPAVQVVSYLVLGSTAQLAYESFLEREGDEFPVVYLGEEVDSIIIGIGPASES